MKIWMTVLILMIAVGCGGESGDGEEVNDIGSNPDVSENCNLEPDDFTNGRDAADADTYWSCLDGDDNYFEFVFFEDGTGVSSGGAFTWREISCGKLETQGADGETTFDNIEGSVSSGILTFRQRDGGDSLNASCILFDL